MLLLTDTVGVTVVARSPTTWQSVSAKENTPAWRAQPISTMQATAKTTTPPAFTRFANAGVAAVLLLLVACTAEPPDPLILATRWAALLEGTLVEEDGCLRVESPDRQDVTSTALVWQMDIFEVTRSGDEVTIVDLYGDNGQPGEPVIWRLGQTLRIGGGELRRAGVIDHAGADFPEKCVGPYWLVSGV